MKILEPSTQFDPQFCYFFDHLCILGHTHPECCNLAPPVSVTELHCDCKHSVLCIG